MHREQVLCTVRTAELLVKVSRTTRNVQVPTGPIQDRQDWGEWRELTGVVLNYERAMWNLQLRGMEATRRGVRVGLSAPQVFSD